MKKEGSGTLGCVRYLSRLLLAADSLPSDTGIGAFLRPRSYLRADFGQ